MHFYAFIFIFSRKLPFASSVISKGHYKQQHSQNNKKRKPRKYVTLPSHLMWLLISSCLSLIGRGMGPIRCCVGFRGFLETNILNLVSLYILETKL